MTTSKPPGASWTCSACKAKGHTARSCPTRKGAAPAPATKPAAKLTPAATAKPCGFCHRLPGHPSGDHTAGCRRKGGLLNGHAHPFAATLLAEAVKLEGQAAALRKVAEVLR